jgi:ethanolamine transporter EutH
VIHAEVAVDLLLAINSILFGSDGSCLLPLQLQQHIKKIKMIRKNRMISHNYSRQGILVATSSYSRKLLLGGGLWFVAALNQCIFIALYVGKKCSSKIALFVAFNLVHAKNCIIGHSDA